VIESLAECIQLTIIDLSQTSKARLRITPGFWNISNAFDKMQNISRKILVAWSVSYNKRNFHLWLKCILYFKSQTGQRSVTFCKDCSVLLRLKRIWLLSKKQYLRECLNWLLLACSAKSGNFTFTYEATLSRNGLDVADNLEIVTIVEYFTSKQVSVFSWSIVCGEVCYWTGSVRRHCRNLIC